jgi:hypothetical protein
MAGTGESDDNRLAGRTPRVPRREPGDEVPEGEPEAAPDDQEIDAVNRLLGFLRGDEA